jgi:hypothetical protein
MAGSMSSLYQCLCIESLGRVLGCPIHAPDLYIEHLVSRFEAGPRFVNIEDDPERPAHHIVEVDGKRKSLPFPKALDVYNNAMDAMKKKAA